MTTQLSIYTSSPLVFAASENTLEEFNLAIWGFLNF